MPVVVPLLSAALAIGAVAGAAVTSQNWSQQRSAALYAEIDADIEKTLRQHDVKKEELAREAPPAAAAPAAASMDSVTAIAKGDVAKGDVAKSDFSKDDLAKDDVARGDVRIDAKNDAKARKAKVASLRKRATGHRRERFVPPDFARMPISILRSAFGALR